MDIGHFMYRFEKLRVYHDSLDLVQMIYKYVSKLPSNEKFAMSDQLRRSSTSVVLNIAEGTGSLGDKEFKQFLRIALKSLYETVAGIKICERLFGLSSQETLEKCDQVGKEINALIKSLKTKD